MRSEREQFEWHVLRHADAAYGLARWLVGNDGDAEDVAQEAIMKAYQAFSKFRGTDGKAWLLTIVRNQSFRHLERRRARAVEPLEEDLLVPIFEETPEAALIRALDAERVRKAVEELPEAYREVIVLREFEDMSYAEIAGVIGSPPGTVMSRLSRARAMLAKSLAEVAR